MPNENQPAEQTAVTGTALLTLDPEQYVTAVFATFRDRLDAAKTAAAAVKVVDVSTADGMRTAVAHRAAFRAIRVEAEKARQSRKKPILEIGRLLDTRAKELEAEITPLEDRFDDAIKAEEKRKEDERIARERAEAERVERIKASIQAIRGVTIDVAGRSSSDIAAAIQRVVAEELTRETVQEFVEDAETVRQQTLAKLRDMHAIAEAREQEAARLKAEREALERDRAEQAERERVERERLAAEQRRQEEAAAAERARIAAEERAARERIEAQEREARERQDAEERRQQAERDRLAAEARVLEERQRAERRENEERERTERLAAEAKEREEREARELAERQERERVEAEERERTGRELERTDIREALKQIRARVNGIDEFAWFATAFDKHHAPAKSRAKKAA